jgi:hypothetical protein
MLYFLEIDMTKQSAATLQIHTNPLADKVINDYASSHITVDDVADIIEIYNEDRNTVVLHREIPTLTKTLNECSMKIGTHITSICRPGEDLTPTLSLHLPTPLTTLFAQDVGHWMQVFADVTESTKIGLRISSMNHAMCPRFHVDKVLLRGDIGPGTQYLANHDVNRAALRPESTKSEHVHSMHVERPNAVIWSARPGDLVLLKGEGWPGNEGFGAVHRSRQWQLKSSESSSPSIF